MRLGAILAVGFVPAVTAITRLDAFNPLLAFQHLQDKQPRSPVEPEQPLPHAKRDTQGSLYLNGDSARFVVNGSTIPEVDFDIGLSFAGLLPVGGDSDGEFFFWFFPTTDTKLEQPQEIVIWLNGGPGCSSLLGMLQENGRFLWQPGTLKPIDNPWSWNHLTNVVYIEQPLGTGFSNGTVTIRNEDDLAQQFMSFWKNFIDTFGMHGYKVYIAGESYAGLYCPYIASNMLDANDTSYFDVRGMIIYDGVIGDGTGPMVPLNYFVQYWENVFPLNDSAKAHVVEASQKCGYDEYCDKYLTFPPSGQQPDVCEMPGVNATCNGFIAGCDIFDFIAQAMLEINPGFSIYQVASLLPITDDVLGLPAVLKNGAPVREIYFNRTDVKKAIHAPLDRHWGVCSRGVFAGDGDDSDASSYRVIPNVIQRTNNVQIVHGSLDMILVANGSMLAIQNMTWNGKMGFQSKPQNPLFVPHHPNPSDAGASGQGVLGTWHEERGLLWLAVELSGHEVPAFQGALAFRQLQKLLGRVQNMSDTTAFPMYADAVQPDASVLGFGVGPSYGREKPPSGSCVMGKCVL